MVRRTKRKCNEIQAMELMIDSEKSETCTGRIKDRHTDRQTYRETDRHTHTPTGRQTDRQTDGCKRRACLYQMASIGITFFTDRKATKFYCFFISFVVSL